MDGGGRVFEPLTGQSPPGASARPQSRNKRQRAAAGRRAAPRRATAANRWIGRVAESVERVRWRRGTGIAATVLILLGSVGFGIVRGGHGPAVLDWLADTRDMAANTVGFRIAGVSMSGHKHLSRDEVLAIAGVSGRSSLLFLDAAAARARLVANPWVGDATVQKLYPDRLAITITERAAFALWQKDGQVNVIAADGTVLESYVSHSVLTLPFVVGAGADTRARDFLAMLDRHPDLRDNVRASVLVGQRRWNLRLKNGIDVKLPEADVVAALDRLAALDREKKLLSRDITAVDLRLPDRVTVRQSDDAAQAREEALKAKRPKPKGGNA